MPLINSWKRVVLENYANFNGRASRAEFWWFYLANLIVVAVLNLLGQAAAIFALLGVLYGLALIVPSIAVGVRRLHDIGKPGTWILIVLIPLVGTIIFLVWAVQPGQPGTNQYGPAPA